MRLKSTYLQTKCYFSDSIKNGNQRYCVQERCLGQLDKKIHFISIYRNAMVQNFAA